jgi:hypothetical protein
MRIPKRIHRAFYVLVLILSCSAVNSVAEEWVDTASYRNGNKSHWVCDYTRGQNDVLLLRCDNLVGLLYDHILLKEGDESKTTQYIPIWRRSHNDQAAIKLVRILLCKQEEACSVEMNSVWALNFQPR